MPLQDIKYILSVSDGQANAAISKTIARVQGLDKVKFPNVGKNLEASIGKSRGVITQLGSMLGGLVNQGLGVAIGQGAASKLTSVAQNPAIRTAFSAAGAVVGAGFAAKAVGGTTAALGRLAAVAGTTFAAIGVAAAVAFGAIAKHALNAWDAVEEGIMRVQAAMVGQGVAIAKAFSTNVEEKILESADRMAIAFGDMPGESAAAIAELVKHGMTLEQALQRQILVSNIANLNKISMAEAAGKVIAAWNGEAKALKEIGIRFADTGNATENARIAQEKLLAMYGKADLAKPFVSDEPFRNAAAAVHMLWVNLGRVLDPVMTAAAQQLADVMLGIVAAIKSGDGSSWIHDLYGAAAAVYTTIEFAVNGVAAVWKTLQIVGQWITQFFESGWYHIKNVVDWIQKIFYTIIEKLAGTMAKLPGWAGGGDRMQAIADSAAKSRAEAEADIVMNKKDLAASAAFGVKYNQQQVRQILSSFNQGGGGLSSLADRGRKLREQAQKDAEAAAQGAGQLPESEKIREDRQIKERDEAEKRAKKEREEAERMYQRNQRVSQERQRYNAQRTTLVLQTPQRMVAAVRFGRRATT